jgi:antagonist of KipI
MSIKIIKPGLFSTIQDLGRIGYRSIGIGPGGAMDFFAATVANSLVGNKEHTPVIEMHFPAAAILFEQDAWVSITGANFSGHIDEEPAPLWTPFLIKKNQLLSFKKYISGARVYLAICGGIVADNWLNSYSTHTKVKAGGCNGRAFIKDDIIWLNTCRAKVSANIFSAIAALVYPVYQPAEIIYCIAGPEWELLSDSAKIQFTDTTFTITTQSDRMGFRLAGKQLLLQHTEPLISSAVDYGTIQLLPNGQLIVLMADHQTTGGYPRIANVISIHLPKLAQSPVNSSLHFRMVSPETATDSLFLMHQNIALIKQQCR